MTATNFSYHIPEEKEVVIQQHEEPIVVNKYCDNNNENENNNEVKRVTLVTPILKKEKEVSIEQHQEPKDVVKNGDNNDDNENNNERKRVTLIIPTVNKEREDVIQKDDELANCNISNNNNTSNSNDNEGNKDRNVFNKSNENSITIKKKKGGWGFAFLVLVNQALATLSFFGVGVNLVLFLTRVLRQDNADAANNVSVWTGTVYLFSLVGAFLSDSYWGRFLTCTIFQIILLMGLVLLSATSWFFMLKPRGCGDGNLHCEKTSTISQVIFYISIYLVALGYGGHQPTCATFGADQFDETTLKGQGSRAAFFAYFYFALNCGSLFSNTVLVYFEDSGSWTFGFLASTIAALLGLIIFVLGWPGYRFIKAHGNPLPRLAQVFIAAYRKWNVEVDSPDELYELEGSQSAIKGSRKIAHSKYFGFLDKAATLTRKDMREPKNPWHICTITQVEEAKCVLKFLPLWLCTIIYSVIFTQMASLFVEQGDVMDTKIGNFEIPAASMSAFDITSVLVCTGLYRHVLVPILGRISGNPKGLTELQRMGVGLIIGMLAMIAAGVTEIQRLKRVTPHEKSSSLSVLWQIPQYFLVGASEVFMYVGQLEFFNGQAPDGIKSFGSSLCMASMSFGNYVSSLLVHMVMLITKRGDNPGWIPSDLNSGHIDRFYFLIMGLTAVDVVIYVLFAKWYKPVTFLESSHKVEGHTKFEDPEEDEEVIRKV